MTAASSLRVERTQNARGVLWTERTGVVLIARPTALNRFADPDTEGCGGTSDHGPKRRIARLRESAGRAWRRILYCLNPARIDLNLAAVVVGDHGLSTWTDHNRITGIALNAAEDDLKALTLIDRRSRTHRVDCSGPGGATRQ